jgi:hypothetical protein
VIPPGYQDEYQRRTWAPVPPTTAGRLTWMMRSGAPGLVEIRAHTATAQLTARAADPRYVRHGAWLVTYQALGPDGRPASSGHARRLRLWAQQFAGGRLTGDVHDLGIITLPDTLPFPRVDLPGFFGMAVEEPIRAHLTGLLGLLSRRVERSTGGAAPGPDLLWSEVAAMYAELASELRDPFLAELAAELAVA